MLVQLRSPVGRVASRQCWLRHPESRQPQGRRLALGRVRAGVGDMLSKGLQGLFSKETEETAPQKSSEESTLYFSNNAPSWDELMALMTTKGQSLNDLSLTQSDYLEVGPPTPLSLKRTFGKEEPIRIKLYRDHAAWCPYCQKVWIQLEEKKIPYTIEKINMRCYGDKPESFYAMVPSGLLPVMELDGKVYTESAVIAELLEKEFPENPLLPEAGGVARQLGLFELFRLERMAFSAWCQWLCQSWAPQQQRANFEGVLRKIESELGVAGGPFFLGPQFSLVDIVFVPFLERMDASLTYYKGFRMRGEGRFPNLERWFAAMESRPTYIATKTDYYTHAFALPPQLGGCVMTKEGEPIAQKICGGSGTWSLPLEPLSADSFEPYSLGDHPEHDTYFAAKKLITNHEAVVKFALRGCGKEGGQPVMAPLSDPTAESGMHSFDATDAALRHVAHALLLGVTEKQSQDAKITAQKEADEKLLPSHHTVQALRYMRDRVGVPRDVKFPEARQLRAHLNWLLDQITMPL